MNGGVADAVVVLVVIAAFLRVFVVVAAITAGLKNNPRHHFTQTRHILQFHILPSSLLLLSLVTLTRIPPSILPRDPSHPIRILKIPHFLRDNRQFFLRGDILLLRSADLIVKSVDLGEGRDRVVGVDDEQVVVEAKGF